MSQQQRQLSSLRPDAEDDESAKIGKDGIPPKPKRPLTVYNLFGTLERNYLVQSSQKRAPDPLQSSSTEGTTSESSPGAIDPYLESRPAKYRDIVLPHDWYKVGRNRIQRKFYQAHGVIEFQGLSKVVKDGWGQVDDETRQFLQTIYDRELAEYKNEMKEYEKLYGKAALDSQKKVYNKRRKADATKPKAKRLSPRDQSVQVLQQHPRTSTVSDTASHMTPVLHVNPQASIANDATGLLSQGSNKSSSYNQWNQPFNPYVENWQMNPYPSEIGYVGNLPFYGNSLSSTGPRLNQPQNSSHHFGFQPTTNHYISSSNTDGSGYDTLQNCTAGYSGSGTPSTSYFPLNQSPSTTFQMGNSLDSSWGSSTGPNNRGTSFGIQAAGMSNTATHSASDQSMSNQASGLDNAYMHARMLINNDALDNHIHPLMQVPTQQPQHEGRASFPVWPHLSATDDIPTFDEQLSESNYFGNQSTTTATLPMQQFQNPTAAAYPMQQTLNQASFAREQTHCENPMYSSTDERSEHRHAATTPYDDDTNLKGIDHTSDNSISESNVMLGEELGNVFDSNSS